MSFKAAYFLALWAPLLLCVIWMLWAAYRFRKTQRLRYKHTTDALIVVNFILFVTVGVLSFNLRSAAHVFFETEKPRCVKLYQEYPIEEHWSWNRDYIVLGEEARHYRIKRANDDRFEEEFVKLSDGDYFYLDEIYVRNFSQRKDSCKTLGLYLLQYDPWWGFEFPSGYEDGWFSLGEDDYLRAGICKDKIELKK